MTQHNKVDQAGDEQLRLLRRMDSRLDLMDQKLDALPKTAARYGAAAGAASGAVAGGLVATGIAIIKAKLGL
jgi:mevalonate kinase